MKKEDLQKFIKKQKELTKNMVDSINAINLSLKTLAKAIENYGM